MKAREIMSKTPSVVTPDTSVQDAARMMQTEDVGVLPVVDAAGSRQLVGLVTDRDIAIRVVAEGRTGATVRDAMTSDPKSCKPDDSVRDVMAVMSSEKVRRVPIVDESGAIVGIISQADIVLQGDDKNAEKTIERISKPGGSHSQ